jgi:biopolymer transport protein ExbD
LTARLEALRLAKPDVAVVLRPHKELTVQQLIGVMDCLRQAKISKVGIVTEQASTTP